MRKYLLFILLLLLLPAHAQDEALAAAIKKALPGYQVSALKVSGNWALCTWSLTEAGGTALFHRYGNKWELAQSGGGAIGRAELAVLGVPPADRNRLVTDFGPDEDDRVLDVLKKPQWTWLTREKTLTEQDLEYLTAWELTLMRNEVFALHGRSFSDPELKRYFQERPWYKARANYNDSDLSRLERANVDFISRYQKKTGKL